MAITVQCPRWMADSNPDCLYGTRWPMLSNKLLFSAAPTVLAYWHVIPTWQSKNRHLIRCCAWYTLACVAPFPDSNHNPCASEDLLARCLKPQTSITFSDFSGCVWKSREHISQTQINEVNPVPETIPNNFHSPQYRLYGCIRYITR